MSALGLGDERRPVGATSGWTTASIRGSAPGSAAIQAFSAPRSTTPPSTTASGHSARQRRDRRPAAARRAGAPPRRRPRPGPQPLRRTSRPWSILPMPMEPVRPRRKRHREHRLARRVVHLGPLAEPALEARHRLVQTACRARPRWRSPRRRPRAGAVVSERGVDEIGHHLPRMQARRAARGIRACPPCRETWCSPPSPHPRWHLPACTQSKTTIRCPNSCAERLGPAAGSVRKADLWRAGLEQRRDHRPRGAARAEHGRRPGRRPAIPGAPWRRFSRNPYPSVLSAWILPSSRKISVFAAPIRAARSVTMSAMSSTASLCGMVTLHADEAHPGHRAQHLRQIVVRDVQRDVVPRQPYPAQPVAVQRRRPRMRDRRADDAGQGDLRLAHASMAPRCMSQREARAAAGPAR